jgi:hypothetical protein
VNLDGEVLWLERASIADIAGDRDAVPVVEQCIRGLEKKGVPAMPLRLRIREHPTHRVNGRFAIVDMLCPFPKRS